MIFLEQATNQALAEEGQVIVSPEDLGLDWNRIESLFVNTYNQAKIYVPIYKWTTMQLSPYGTNVEDVANIKHIVYNSYQRMQRFMPDIDQRNWEFNPYTHELKTLISTSYSLEYTTYSHCGSLPYSQSISNTEAGKIYIFKLPSQFNQDSFEINNGTNKSTITSITTDSDGNEIAQITGTIGTGEINLKTLEGFITSLNNETVLNIKMNTKYAGILELDLTCELFFTWFKANLLGLIGGIKEQIELPGVGLPFALNQDTLLSRARELHTTVERLKESKSYWSNF